MKDLRKYSRRAEDAHLKTSLAKSKEILDIGRMIVSETNFHELFDIIADKINYIMEVDRCSIFLIDEKDELLNAYVSAGIDNFEISIPTHKGIAGWVFQTLEPAIVNNINEDNRFYPDIDIAFGIKTNNLICIPLIDKSRQGFGVLEIVNKHSGDFSPIDLELLTDLANYISIALENARLIEQLNSNAMELKKSEEKYRTILESIVDGYFEVDIGGNLTFFNDAMCQILGYSKVEMMGMNNKSFMSSETQEVVYETFNNVFLTGQPTKAFGWELIRKDGEIKYVETSVSLIKDQDGHPNGFRGITRDITELRAFEKAKERVINHLSHELGTPISIINAAIDIIPREIENNNKSKVYAICSRLKRNAKRLKEMQDIIDDIIGGRISKLDENIVPTIENALNMLELAKWRNKEINQPVALQDIIETLESLIDAPDIRIEEFSLDDIIYSVVDEANSLMDSRKLHISYNNSESLYIHSDMNALKKVFRGILRNAIENTPDEGTIRINTKRDYENAIVEFEDNGVGITAQNQKMIFGGFFHTQDTLRYSSKEPYAFNAGGWGTDLLRAKVLSERLGFFIGFTSKRCSHLPLDSDECPGSISACPFVSGPEECCRSGGTTFSLTFPLSRFHA